MKNEEKIELHEEVCKSIHNMYIDKNNDYGDSVHDTFEKFGMDAFTVRMYDKLNRIYALTRPETEHRVSSEKIEDTLLDLANYAILAFIELQDRKVKTYENIKATE